MQDTFKEKSILGWDQVKQVWVEPVPSRISKTQIHLSHEPYNCIALRASPMGGESHVYVISGTVECLTVSPHAWFKLISLAADISVAYVPKDEYEVTPQHT